jgi:nicotinamidase-related amidase
MAVMTADPEYLVAGTPDAEVIPELAPEPADLVAARYHGMSAFTGTELDAILRAMDIETVVIGGVSLNEAVIGIAIEAVNLGYRVVIPSDAVMGLPYEFGQDVLRYAMRLLGPVVPVDAILAVWGRNACAPSDRSDSLSMD